MKTLIINGDDFGWSREVVDSIITLHRKGVMNSTSVMTTMPAFDYGIEKLRENPDLGAGVHMSLFNGVPVLLPSKVPSLIDPETGRFLTFEILSNNKRRLKVDEAAAEFEAQIKKFLDTGLTPTHLDVHTSLPYMIPKLYKAILGLNKKYGLPMRALVGRDLKEKSRILTRRQKIPAVLIRIAGNRLIKGMEKNGISHPDYFVPEFSDLNNAATVETKKELIKEILSNLKEGVTEVLTHPSLADDNWRQVEHKVWDDPTIEELLKNEGLNPVSYRALS